MVQNGTMQKKEETFSTWYQSRDDSAQMVFRRGEDWKNSEGSASGSHHTISLQKENSNPDREGTAQTLRGQGWEGPLTSLAFMSEEEEDEDDLPV